MSKMKMPVGKALVACDKAIKALVKTMEVNDNSSSLLVTVLKLIAGYFNRDMTKDETRYIADGVSVARGYEGRTAVNRRSEIRKVLRVHRALPAAIVAYCKAHPLSVCGWIPAVRLAGELDGWNGGTQSQRITGAVKAIMQAKPPSSSPSVPTTKAAQFTRAAKVVAELSKLTKLPKGFRDELRALNTKYLGD